MALGIGLGFNDVLGRAMVDGSTSNGSSSSRSGLRWWSAFQETLPESRRLSGEAVADSGRTTGNWFRISRRSARGFAPRRGGFDLGRFDVAGLGIDRGERISLIKERFLSDFLFGWRFNRWFAREIDPPAKIPVPPALWLLGSALAGLTTFARRRSLRRGEAARR